MKRELEIEITNLFGSAEYPRQVTVSKPKITRTKKKSMKRSDTDIQVNTATDEQQTEESQENVNSFNMAGGKPTIRLGGAYGKLQGLLKEAGLTLATAGEPEFTKTGVLMIVPTIQIFPEFCELEMDGSQMHEVKGLVTVNSRFRRKGDTETDNLGCHTKSHDKNNGHISRPLRLRGNQDVQDGREPELCRAKARKD